MKTYILLLLVLLAAPLFAATTADVTAKCQQSCCSQFGGTWSGASCSGANADSYPSCVQTCEEVASGNYSCCGGAFMLAFVSAAVLAVNGRRSG